MRTALGIAAALVAIVVVVVLAFPKPKSQEELQEIMQTEVSDESRTELEDVSDRMREIENAPFEEEEAEAEAEQEADEPQADEQGTAGSTQEMNTGEVTLQLPGYWSLLEEDDGTISAASLIDMSFIDAYSTDASDWEGVSLEDIARYFALYPNTDEDTEGTAEILREPYAVSAEGADEAVRVVSKVTDDEVSVYFVVEWIRAGDRLHLISTRTLEQTWDNSEEIVNTILDSAKVL